MYEEKITGFNLYKKKTKSTMHHGSMYIKTISIPFSPEPRRKLRVWIPDDYDGSKRFGVLYMADGQNMCDRSMAAFGEWELDDHITNLENSGYDGLIIVGIDCPYDPKTRMEEYTVIKCDNGFKGNTFKAYGEKMCDYLVHKIKPYIDSKFMTIPKQTGFIGSSMGGLFSFFICSKYPNIFSYCLAFSTAFFLFDKEKLHSFVEAWNPEVKNSPKYVFYCGGKDEYERKFYEGSLYVYNYLVSKGFNDKKIMWLYRPDLYHHENSWSTVTEECLKFCLEK